MSLSVMPSLSVPRTSPAAVDLASPPPDHRAVVAVLPALAAPEAHHELAAALPGRSVRTWSAGPAEGVVDELAHRDLARFAARGVVAGAVLLGLLTLAVTYGATGLSLGVAASLGLATGVTGGAFFGSLGGFFLAVLRWHHAHEAVRVHGRDGAAPGVVVVEGDGDPRDALRILRGHGATVVETAPT